MNILNTLQQLEPVTEKGTGKSMFLKCRGILKDYKSERNFFKMLEAHILVTLQALNLQLCQKIISTTSILQ